MRYASFVHVGVGKLVGTGMFVGVLWLRSAHVARTRVLELTQRVVGAVAPSVRAVPRPTRQEAGEHRHSVAL